MISVVIPLYNKEKSILSTLQTVLNQTFQDFEIVVVDDGSKDNSAEIVEKVNDSRINLIRQTNGGVSSARNRGIQEAKGEFVALLDADDQWKPEFLSVLFKMTQKYKDCSVFGCDYLLNYPNGKIENNIINRLKFDGEIGKMDNYFEVATYGAPPICSISTIIKRDALLSIGGFPVGIKSGEDLLTWAKLAVNYKIAYCRKALAVYNMGDGYDFNNLPPRRQDSSDPVGKELVRLLKKYPETPLLKEYISHWHKMRASLAIRYGEKKETFKEILLGLKFNPLNFSLFPFLILILMPEKIRKFIISRRR